MGILYSQTRLLLWKNYLLKCRHFKSTVSEILLPLGFVLLVVWLQTLDGDKDLVETSYTCPRQSSISPTLLFPEDPDEHKEFIFEISTEGMGPGIRTVPPLAYLMMIASKIHYVIALAPNEPNDPAKIAWLEKFSEAMDAMTKGFDSSAWGIVNGFTKKYFGFGFCSFGKMTKIYSSESELQKYVKSDSYGDTEWPQDEVCPDAASMDKPKIHIALVLNKLGTDDGIWDYTIQTNMSVIPYTYPRLGFTNDIDPGVDELYIDQYMMSGFLTLQQAVDRYIIDNKVSDERHITKLAIRQVCDTVAPYVNEIIHGGGGDIPFPPGLRKELNGTINCTSLVNRLVATLQLNLDPLTEPVSLVPNDIRMSEFPTPAYTDRPFYEKIKDIFALQLILTFLWPISRLIRGIVDEKETKQREGMRMMGLRYNALFLSWFITYAVLFFTIAASITGMTSFGLFNRSSPLIVFLYFFLFGLSIIAYCFMISILFSRAKTASTAGVVLFFMGFFPYFGISSTNATASSKSMASILSPTAFGIGASILANYEGSGEGVTFTNLFDTPNDSQIPFGQILVMLVVDTILYMFLAFYLDNVVPQEFGVRRKWNFLCTRRYWTNSEHSPGHKLLHTHLEGQSETTDPHFFEKPSPDLIQMENEDKCIKLQELTKVYHTASGEKRVANNAVNLTIFEGQIFGLLGHNGAGKSTMISVLTGLIPKTSGEATIYGMDISNDMDDIRQSLGVCPQHDVLWPDLTVEEHLRFFADLKCSSNPDEEVEKYIKQIGLKEKRNVAAGHLSGGQRRRLSTAIALLGNSKVVFLDEATSGIDPYNRRKLWDMVRLNRAGRIIIMTTHFMDEAEYADRIGIMRAGQLQCCGTPLFLKTRYGTGYTLSFVLKVDDRSGSRQDSKRKELSKAVMERVPEATVISSVGAEVVLKMPLTSSPQFPAMFAEVDARKSALNIQTYGVSVTTLEEVFLKIAEDSYTHKHHHSREENHNLYRRMSDDYEAQQDSSREQFEALYSEISGSKKFFIQVKALLLKRRQYAKRDRKSLCCNTILPILLLIMGFSLLKAFPLHQNPPALKLNMDMFNQDENYMPFNISVPTSGFPADFMPEAVAIDAEIPKGLNNSCPLDPKESDIWDGSNLRGLSEWLLDHQHDNKTSLYGAAQYNELDPRRSVEVTIMSNSSAFHGAGVFMNLVNQGLYRYILDDANVTIHATNMPFAFTSGFNELLDSLESIDASMSIVIAFSFVPASVAIFVVKEREISAKHQQIISGTSILAFWVSSYVWDMFMFLVPWVCCSTIVYAFDLTSFRGENFICLVVLFFAYGMAVLPFTYMISFAFESHSTAQNVVLLMCFITGLILLIASIVMSAIESTYHTNKILKYFYRLFPGFCLGNGLLGLTINKAEKDFLPSDMVHASPFAWNVAGAEITYLFAESLLYFGITLWLDYMYAYPLLRKRLERYGQGFRRFCNICSCGLFCKDTQRKRKLLRQVSSVGTSASMATPLLEVEEDDMNENVQDDDVLNEAKRIDNSHQLEDVVVLRHLRKKFDDGKVAVRGLSFGIPKGGCVFGLLGANGAGKTTALKMLTGDILPTSGTAELVGFDILREQGKLRRRLGYCPQFDALLEHLTVREHLELYARLKCIPEELVYKTAQEKIEHLNLDDYHDKTAGSLSGGNRRKLSLAIAMVGSPPLIFLDEPSSGIDPSSRRFMWDVIARLSTSTTVILTTHSMEECEALSHLVGIMVDGQFAAYGPIQHLKTRFGKGLVLTAKLRLPTEDAARKCCDQITHLVQGEIHGLPEVALGEACGILGNPERVTKINREDSTGSLIQSMLDSSGHVDPLYFCEWWLAEDTHDALAAFLSSHFEIAECLEKRGQNSRWRIDDPKLSLGQTFEIIENSNVGVEEHSIGQTSLEQVFLSFASKQTDDEVVVS